MGVFWWTLLLFNTSPQAKPHRRRYETLFHILSIWEVIKYQPNHIYRKIMQSKYRCKVCVDKINVSYRKILTLKGRKHTTSDNCLASWSMNNEQKKNNAKRQLSKGKTRQNCVSDWKSPHQKTIHINSRNDSLIVSVMQLCTSLRSHVLYLFLYLLSIAY